MTHDWCPHVLAPCAQVVADEDRARAIAKARAQRADDYRRLQMASALFEQRRREAGRAAMEAARQRAQGRAGQLADRKRRTADKLAQVGPWVAGALVLVGASGAPILRPCHL